MEALVVRKTTSLDLMGEYVRNKVNEGILSPEHLQSMRDDHREHLDTLEHLRALLGKLGVSFREVSHGVYWPDVGHFDVVITVGGDGSVLDASHHIDSETTPIVGIRSSRKSVGHLCYRGSEDLEETLEALCKNALPIHRVARLRAVIKSLRTDSEQTTSPILNDFLFCNENPAATSRYGVVISSTNGGKGSAKAHLEEVQKSSGIWVSTAAGSSAAMRSAGGEVMPLDSKDFQYRVREPYHRPGGSYKLLGGVFDPDTTKLAIENLSDEAVLAVDGHHNSFSLGYGDTIRFERAPSLCLALNR